MDTTTELLKSLQEHNQQVQLQLAEQTKVLQELSKTMQSMHQYIELGTSSKTIA